MTTSKAESSKISIKRRSVLIGASATASFASFSELIAAMQSSSESDISNQLDSQRRIPSDHGVRSYTPAAEVRNDQGDAMSASEFGIRPGPFPNDRRLVAKALASGKTIIFAPGVYLMGDVHADFSEFQGTTRLVAEGVEQVTLKQTPSSGGMFTVENRVKQGVNSSSFGLEIHGMTLKGATNEGFSEHNHILSVNGIRNMKINSCTFEDPRGDSIYLGSGVSKDRKGRNEFIAITNCRFRSISTPGRNAISIINGNDIQIEGCHFSNTSQSNMPGAIDIEPNDGLHYWIRNVTVRNCVFERIGGAIGAVSFVFRKRCYVERSGGFEVMDCTFDTPRSINIMGMQCATNPLVGIAIKGNKIRSTRFAISIDGAVRDMSIMGNAVDGAIRISKIAKSAVKESGTTVLQ